MEALEEGVLRGVTCGVRDEMGKEEEAEEERDGMTDHRTGIHA